MSLEADDDFLFTLSDVEKEEEPATRKRNNKRPRARGTKKGGKWAATKKEKVMDEEEVEVKEEVIEEKVMDEEKEVEVKEEVEMKEEEKEGEVKKVEIGRASCRERVCQYV